MCCCNPYMNRAECYRSRYPKPYGFGDEPPRDEDEACECECHDEQDREDEEDDL